MSLRDSKLGLVILVVIGGAIAIFLSIALVVVAWLYVSNGEGIAGPAADKAQRDIEIEFQQISPLPLAVPFQHNSMRKANGGLVTANYKTERGYEEIKAYYQKELASRGWRFVREETYKYDGQDLGGKQLFYCKGEHSADLQYAGRLEEEFGWTYSFALLWGPSDWCK